MWSCNQPARRGKTDFTQIVVRERKERFFFPSAETNMIDLLIISRERPQGASWLTWPLWPTWARAKWGHVALKSLKYLPWTPGKHWRGMACMFCLNTTTSSELCGCKGGTNDAGKAQLARRLAAVGNCGRGCLRSAITSLHVASKNK